MQGYKHTELGWIPEDWDVKELGSVISYKKGYAFKSVDYVSKGRRIIRISDTTANSIKDDSQIFIDESEVEQYRNYELVKGDTIISTVGSRPPLYDSMVGKALQVPKEYEGALLNQNAVRIRGVDIDNNFLFYNFNNKRHYNFIESLVRGNANQASIALEELFKYLLPIPPKAEQARIAKVLYIWDRFIETLTQLIAAKVLLKKGLMQQLLTGKKRLPEFDDVWQPVEFGKVFEFIKTESFSREDLTNDGNVLYIHYGDIHALYNGDHLDIKAENRIPYLKADLGKKNGFAYLRDGDLIIADASEDYEGVGECTEVINIGDKKIIGGLHTIVARDKEGLTSPLFRGYILKNSEVSLMLKKLAVGISVYGISKSSLATLKIKLPSLKEQTAIANILASSEMEIQMLQSQHLILKEQKQGLMQQLLTGKKRVKV